MARPINLKTKIFLDSGDPEETKQALKMLGFLDGQTTNPSLIAKNPETAKRIESGEKFFKDEIIEFYKGVVKEISSIIPDGSVSIEVYADANTKMDEMLNQGREFFNWIPNAHIKYPTTKEGLKAAESALKKGIRVNMTLVFTQEQAAAVYSATKADPTPGVSIESHPRGGIRGGILEGFKNVFVSPFIGRLDDIGENGMDLIKNIIKMYETGDKHAEVLTASVRNSDHFLEAIRLQSDIITAPFKILKEWGELGMPIPDENFKYNPELKPMEYKDLDLNKPWTDFNLEHELTTKGIEKFSLDWDNLIK